MLRSCRSLLFHSNHHFLRSKPHNSTTSSSNTNRSSSGSSSSVGCFFLLCFANGTPTRHRSSGILGLPNVGKSTLFNALTRTQLAEAANYPFCTIEPNAAKVSIPDARLERLAAVANSEKIVYSQLEFVDIAGLVQGAHKGEGLGNKFLSNIREVSLLLHVVRCYEDSDVIHVHNSIDPMRDIDIIETELALADLQMLEKRVTTAAKKVRANGDQDSQRTISVLAKCQAFLDKGKMISSVPASTWSPAELAVINSLQLLTSKPMVYVCNVDMDNAKDGNELTRKVAEHAASQGRHCMIVSAKLEAEASACAAEKDQFELLEMAGVDRSGLQRMISVAAEVLDLQRFYTIGPSEAHSWLIPKGISAVEAAGKIHSDIERGFIKAEVIKPDDFLQLGGEKGVKAAGKVGQFGKQYIVEDGDIMNFRFS